MTPRDVIVRFPEHQAGQPHRVVLEHKPTGLRVEGEGDTVATALALAEERLDKDLAVEKPCA